MLGFVPSTNILPLDLQLTLVRRDELPYHIGLV